MIVALAALVAATAAQPARRETSSTPVRSDAELYLTFDVSRSMLAASTPGGRARFERARAVGRTVLAGIRRRADGSCDPDQPDDAAALPDRRRTFGERRDRSLAADHAAAPGSVHDSARELAVGARARRRPELLRPDRPKRALVVFTDLDSDAFSLPGTLRILRRHRIEPFVVRVARPGERVFDASGRPYAYRSVSTVTVASLRSANWHAFEERDRAQLVAAIRDYLGAGPVSGSGLVESQQNLAPYTAFAALVLAVLLLAPALSAANPARRPPRERQATSG